MARRPDFGLLLPHEEGPGVPSPTWSTIRDVAREAEDVAQHADIWNAWLVSRRTNELPALHETVDAACVRHHREPSTLRRTLGVPIVLEGPTMGWPGVVHGSEEQVAESLRIIAGDRIDEIQLILFPTSPRTVQTIGRIVELAING